MVQHFFTLGPDSHEIHGAEWNSALDLERGAEIQRKQHESQN